MLDQEEFKTIRDILRNRRKLMATMSERFVTRTMDEWAPILRTNDVWFSPMIPFEQAMRSQQLLATGGVDSVEGVPHGLVSAPVKLSAFRHGSRGRAPRLGEHTESVVAGLRSSL